jgi:hypothetical protein
VTCLGSFKASSSFLKKRTKKTSLNLGMGVGAVTAHAPESKKFLRRFFQKAALLDRT